MSVADWRMGFQQRTPDGAYAVTCFFQIAYPEHHYPNVGAWYNPVLPAPVNRWTWCWEHKHDADVRVGARPMEPGT